MEYPELKRRIVQHAAEFSAENVVIEDRASGTQLIQDLIEEGFPGVIRYSPKMDKVLRLNSVTNMIENGQVYLPSQAEWLRDYLNELITFPNGKFDDQADSTSQALDWARARRMEPGIITFTRYEARKYLVSQGRMDEVQAMDDKYGVPPERFL
jgi:predicted phage terminase large subunit-like protein